METTFEITFEGIEQPSPIDRYSGARHQPMSHLGSVEGSLPNAHWIFHTDTFSGHNQRSSQEQSAREQAVGPANNSKRMIEYQLVIATNRTPIKPYQIQLSRRPKPTITIEWHGASTIYPPAARETKRPASPKLAMTAGVMRCGSQMA